ncbi:hypothetical protein [Hydrocarboniphaga sp.]|uniref:hypothetical protein n=1 Tax=Hydrocarboniphaga sp. TaxID=2033016 RepID=UPI003D0BC5C0
MNQASLDTELVSDARDQLIVDMQTLTTHAQELLQATRLLTEDAVTLARGKLEASLASATQRLSDLPRQVQERSRTAATELEAQLVAHPRESLAAAALASMALGWLSRGSATGLINNVARASALGITALAGSVLWSYRERTKAGVATAPAEEVGRWESEGGSAPSATE